MIRAVFALYNLGACASGLLIPTSRMLVDANIFKTSNARLLMNKHLSRTERVGNTRTPLNASNANVVSCDEVLFLAVEAFL